MLEIVNKDINMFNKYVFITFLNVKAEISILV